MRYAPKNVSTLHQNVSENNVYIINIVLKILFSNRLFWTHVKMGTPAVSVNLVIFYV